MHFYEKCIDKNDEDHYLEVDKKRKREIIKFLQQTALSIKKNKRMNTKVLRLRDQQINPEKHEEKKQEPREEVRLSELCCFRKKERSKKDNKSSTPNTLAQPIITRQNPETQRVLE